MRTKRPITPTAMASPKRRREDQHGHQHDEHESDADRGPRLEDPSGRVRPGSVGTGIRRRCACGGGRTPCFGRGSPSSKVRRGAARSPRAPAEGRQLSTQPISLGEPRRRPVQMSSADAPVFDAGRRELALERGDRRRAALPDAARPPRFAREATSSSARAEARGRAPRTRSGPTRTCARCDRG